MVYENHAKFTQVFEVVAISIKACLHTHKRTSGAESEWDTLYKRKEVVILPRFNSSPFLVNIIIIAVGVVMIVVFQNTKN